MKHSQSSNYLDLKAYKLHYRSLMPFKITENPVLMLHGAIENGRIFYSQQGKGFGCYLADHGFPSYCVDFAGRGLSTPKLKEGLQHSQHQLITQDIPALIAFLYEKYQKPVHVVCHSWGGVVLVASLLRFPELRSKVKSILCFGTKRQITVKSWQRRLQIDWFWNHFAPWLAAKYGYLPAKKFRLGADDEPRQFLLDTIAWIKPSRFQDPLDDFDYQAQGLQLADWPRSLFVAAVNDKILGHPQDVKLFMNEAGLTATEFRVLGKAFGNQVDYDHISMLTHPNARQDHFVELVSWLMQGFAKV